MFKQTALEVYLFCYDKHMTAEIPQNKPEKEKREVLDDNARKFIVEPINALFLEENDASSFKLTVDWLETNEDNETKIAYKDFGNGNVQILLISKTTVDGNRTSEKKKITKEEYEQLKNASILHLEKTRYEFAYIQNDIPFSVKYDEFANSELRVLEVDALSEKERDSFNSDDFPVELGEVTGDMQYYGYRVAEVV
jgi:hypothetical protein